MKSVAIVLATYNGAKYLAEQLDCLKKQTYPNIHVYIHDDVSSDGTINIINQYINSEQTNVHFTLWDQKKLKYPQCFINTLLSIPRADYYAFSDQDDVWNEDKIEKAVKAIEKFGDENIPSLFYSAVDYYDGDLNYIRAARFVDKKRPMVDIFSLQTMLLGGEAMGMTFLFNNKLRDDMRIVVEDGGVDFKDTFMKIYSAACGTVIYSSEPCAKYRRHAEATTVGMNPAGKLSRLVNMIKRIFIDKDGMESIQKSVDFIYTKYRQNIRPENLELMRLFSRPNSNKKRMKKVFWTCRFRLKTIDEIGYRVAFLLGRI